MILLIGLKESDLSPIRVASMPCPASNPESKRIVVPEFPQSRISSGCLKDPP